MSFDRLPRETRRTSIAALRHRDFRLLWVGLLISFSGSTMQTAAILWHVSVLVPADERGLALGVVGLVRVGPVLMLSLGSGVVADALDRRRLMMVTQVTLALVAGVLALLTAQGLRVVWPIYVLAAANAAVEVVDLPARQALIPALVTREHLANAIGLNHVMLQIASMAGPALGGIVIASLGVAWAYALNAVSFLCVWLALAAMRDVRTLPAAAPSNVSLRAALDGLRFVAAVPIIRWTMLLEFLASFFASAMALLPIFARDILNVGPSGYGWLYAAPAVGSVLASAAMVHAVDRVERRGCLLLWSMAGYGVATVVFGVSRSFWLTFACLAATGAAHTIGTALRAIIRQLETPDHLRGRMVGINAIVSMGGPQLGDLEAGLVAQWWSAPLSVITGGIASLVATLWIAIAVRSLRGYRKPDSATAAARIDMPAWRDPSGARPLHPARPSRTNASTAAR
jgi:MFS family permease